MLMLIWSILSVMELTFRWKCQFLISKFQNLLLDKDIGISLESSLHKGVKKNSVVVFENFSDFNFLMKNTY